MREALPNQVESKKHVPIRTCVGCGRKSAQSSLIRLVKANSGVIIVDFNREYPGRGAWVHAEAKCVRNAVSRGRLWRTLRVPVNAGVKQELLSELLQASDLDTRGALGLTDYESG